MSRIVSVDIGKRFYFEDDGAAVRIIRGEAEVYASVEERKAHVFMGACGTGRICFGLADEEKQAELFLLAKTPLEAEIFDEAELTDRQEKVQLRENMKAWLSSLIELPWVAPFYNRHDELVGQWDKCDFLFEASDDDIWPVFARQRDVLSMLITVYFSARDKQNREQMLQRRKKREYLKESTLKVLFGGADSDREEAIAAGGSDGLVRLVMEALRYYNMEVRELTISKYAARHYKDAEAELLKYLWEKAGIRYRMVHLEPGWQRRDSGLLFVRFEDEYALALPEDDGYQLLLQSGTKIPLDEAVTAKLSPEAFAVYAAFPSAVLNKKDLLRFVFQQSIRADWLTILLASIAIGLIPLLTPLITDKIFSDVIPIHDYQGLVVITQVMVVSAFTVTALTAVRGVAVMRIASGGGMAGKAALLVKLLSLPMTFFHKYTTGELAVRFDSFERILSFFANNTISTVFNALFSLWSLILMCYYSWRLTLVAAAVWGVYLIASLVINYRQMKDARELTTAENANSGQVIQLFSGLGKFRSRGDEEQAFFLWSKSFSKVWQKRLVMRKNQAISTVLNAAEPLLLTLAIYYLTGQYLFESDHISVTEFMAFSAAFSGFNNSLLSMVPVMVQAAEEWAYLDNLRPILEVEPESKSDKNEAGEIYGDIRLENIAFAYDDGPEILRDISLHIKPGECVAIAGPSGCGKSTLMKLILGFETPLRGSIFFDGQDFADLDKPSVRRQMGVVLQDGKLMSGSILENITGVSNLTIDDAMEAARKVGLAQDIEEMPMGLHTMISDGSTNISGGQRQRILLARALVHNPAVILLDEATSALDNTTQAIVTESLNALKCTRLVIAHRLSTIRKADRIIVLDKGTIAEQGTYDELMAKNGLFAGFASRQIA